MPIIELTCISCPLGCPLKVETDDRGQVLQVTGNTCKRGEIYGKKEVTAPTRMVSSTVQLLGGEAPVVSVRTKWDIPKDKIFPVMEEIRRIKVQAPVKIGDVVLENAAGTGVEIIATTNVKKAVENQ
jgi:CxxC motif-containing protein